MRAKLDHFTGDAGDGAPPRKEWEYHQRAPLPPGLRRR
jgi:hypothetical protein